MNETLFEKIKEITELQGTSGQERLVRAYMKEKITPLVDYVEQDGLGGIFGIKEAKEENAPRIMVASHMDEVGFMVSQIQPNGFLSIAPLGGWNPYTVQAQRYTLFTRNGDKIPVISSSVPPHLLRGGNGGSGATDVTSVLFDAGFYSKEEAESFGVSPGDFIVPESIAIQTANKKNVICKAWDNRYGCLMVLEALRHFEGEELPYTLIAGSNVQEEVGLRGAHVSTTKFNPDLFFAVDTSPAQDLTPGNAQGRLGEGTMLRILDPGHIMLPKMREFLLDTCNDEGIKYQYYVSKGGTDAGAAHLQNSGVPSAVIGMPSRYIHSHQTMFNISDYEQAQALLNALLKNLTPSLISDIING